jgi:L-iditol 2-dehydrogenase
MKNKAAYMTQLDKIEIRDIPVPSPKPEEVLVKLEYVGICGSDVHYFHDGRCGDYVVDGEFLLGHECAGVVADIGTNVKRLKIGDKVALEPGITCGMCDFCKSGKYNLCPDVQFLATPPVPGCFAKYITFPENMCFVLPDNMTTKEGALVEPLSVGLHAVNQACASLGDRVVIFGAGCIGLMTMMACQAHGISDISVVDVIDTRLEHAEKLGAARTVNGAKTDAVKEILAISGGTGAEKVFECSGAPVCISQTPYVVGRGGTITLVGMAAQPEVSFNFAQIMSKEAEIKSVFRYRNIYPQAIAAISSGRLNVADIVTHEFGFDDIEHALLENVHNKNEVVKAVIRIDG